jgi:hypothetical protein
MNGLDASRLLLWLNARPLGGRMALSRRDRLIVARHEVPKALRALEFGHLQEVRSENLPQGGLRAQPRVLTLETVPRATRPEGAADRIC